MQINIFIQVSWVCWYYSLSSITIWKDDLIDEKMLDIIHFHIARKLINVDLSTAPFSRDSRSLFSVRTASIESIVCGWCKLESRSAGPNQFSDTENPIMALGRFLRPSWSGFYAQLARAEKLVARAATTDLRPVDERWKMRFVLILANACIVFISVVRVDEKN